MHEGNRYFLIGCVVVECGSGIMLGMHEVQPEMVRAREKKSARLLGAVSRVVLLDHAGIGRIMELAV